MYRPREIPRNTRARGQLSFVRLLLVAATILLSGHTDWCTALKCSRMPEGHGALKTPADGRFHIRISENTAKYTPGKTYSITLEGIDAGGRQSPNPMRHKFSGFMLVVEKKSNDSAIQDSNPIAYGVFTLMHANALTKITCANMVTHTTTTPKSEIQVLWTAPEPGNGCVAFKATVIEHRDVWYMDDGPLTKEFCEDEQTFDDALPLTIDPCCACTEAKYELTFEGLWSRNTHPKDFPSNNWLTRFSDIIGATHTNDYRFWEYGQVSSSGLQQVAEHGATRVLEAELKGNSDAIRTIIKARGLAYPNVTGKTFAVFRVDRNHHLMSFVSMIDPSPDWFVGVSRLELCLSNCTWVENKVLDLYPWDAGTDSGPTYISPDQPTNPQDNIRRIRPDHPNDPRSPFYDANGAAMKPLARLYLLRQRLYEKNCPQENGRSGSSEGGPDAEAACATSNWSKWSKCDTDCGTGNRMRQRHYLNPAMADDCQKELTQRNECVAQPQRCDNNAQSGEQEEVTEAGCALTEWSEFSECTPKCGNGTMIKRRKYVKPRARKRCEGGQHHPRLEIIEPCENPEPCVGDITSSEERLKEGDQETTDPVDENAANEDEGAEEKEDEEADPTCKLREWSIWSKCSVTCGGGYKTRQRRPQDMPRCRKFAQTERKKCNWGPCPIPGYCREMPMACEETNRNALPADSVRNMWFHNQENSRCEVFTWTCGNHRNRFNTLEVCDAVCITGITGEMQNEDEPKDNINQRRGGNGRNSNNRRTG